MKSVLTADLGGTKCRFALVTEDQRVLHPQRVPTPRGREALLQAIDDAFDRLLASLPRDVDAPAAIGVGTAGVVRPDGRSIVYAPNLPLDGHPLADHLQERHHLPAVVMNDGRASALGEFHWGAARGKDPLLALFFGTGIGIGLIAGGRPYGGATNAAGEIGHTVHVPAGRVCACGRRGCYEAYCGGGPMGRRATAELGPPAAGGDVWRMDAIVQAAATSPVAREILEEAERAAGALVASACTLLNPAAVVLGGGVLKGWPALRGSVERAARAWCSDVVARDLVFVPSLAEADAILLGAAAATGALWATSPSP